MEYRAWRREERKQRNGETERGEDESACTALSLVEDEGNEKRVHNKKTLSNKYWGFNSCHPWNLWLEGNKFL